VANLAIEGLEGDGDERSAVDGGSAGWWRDDGAALTVGDEWTVSRIKGGGAVDVRKSSDGIEKNDGKSCPARKRAAGTEGQRG
jgi:hypothetical protein